MLNTVCIPRRARWRHVAPPARERREHRCLRWRNLARSGAPARPETPPRAPAPLRGPFAHAPPLRGFPQVMLGLYIVRGDNIALVGEVDEEIDAEIDLAMLKAEPLKAVVH